MTLETNDPIASVEDAGERLIAEKLAEILHQYSALCQILAKNVKPMGSHVAAQLVTEQLGFDEICDLVRNSIAPFRLQQQNRSEDFERHMKSIPSFLLQLVWHRKLATQSPMSANESGMVVNAAITISPSLSEIFLEIISSLSDCAPMLYELDERASTAGVRSNSIKVDNSLSSEEGALDVKSHLNQVLRQIHSQTLGTLAGKAAATNTIHMKDSNLSVSKEPLQLEALKFQLRRLRREGIRLFFFRSDPQAYALTDEALENGLTKNYGFTPELVRILKPTEKLTKELEDWLQITNSALVEINGCLSK
jgi:hypothetical protein